MNSVASRGTFRVASYNVLNLFDKIDDPDKRDEGTRPKSAQSVRALADIIESSEADVIALQEVENIEILKQFRNSNGLADDYPHVVLVEGNDGRGIDVALLSKHPVTNVESHKDEVFPVKGQKDRGFLRDLLQADIQIPNYGPVRFFLNHFASKRGGKRADRMREAEATAARDIIKRETADFPGQKYVMLGDFNDKPDSKSVQTLTKKDKDGWGLVDAFREEPETVSYPTSERTARKWGYKRIDHILMSPEMAKTQVEEQAHKHPESKKASDHWMVSADFALTS
jgi:endonuclease/exonuclease/phosphatase family metal-dependent hydrolase